MGICRWLHRLALTALLLLAVLAPVSGAPTAAATQTLSVDGSAPVASDTTCAPCKTIQGALNLAGPGASITVAPGTYPETLTITQSVSITGGVPFLPGEQGPTIVDARGVGSVVTIPKYQQSLPSIYFLAGRSSDGCSHSAGAQCVARSRLRILAGPLRRPERLLRSPLPSPTVTMFSGGRPP